MTPVGAGINLEYFFSRIDQVQYGAGTKLPHNITGLVGVMDGWTSDLRTGLPKQMIEIHEPMRLLLIVETTPDRLLLAASAHPGVKRLVEHAWLRVATLDPGSDRVHVLEGGRFVLYRPSGAELPVAPSSTAHYRGQRDHLPVARISGSERS